MCFTVASLGRVLDFGYFVGNFFVSAVNEIVHREHDVHLVGAVGNGKRCLNGFHLQASLRRWEIGRANSHVHLRNIEVFAHHLGKLRVNADGSHVRVPGIVVFKVIDALSECSHRAFAVVGAQRGEVDAVEQKAIHLVGGVFGAMLFEQFVHGSFNGGIVGGHLAAFDGLQIFV